jgi:hypothetical protein
LREYLLFSSELGAFASLREAHPNPGRSGLGKFLEQGTRCPYNIVDLAQTQRPRAPLCDALGLVKIKPAENLT